MRIINPEIIDSIVKELDINDIGSASIRQIGAVVRAVEARTGTEFIHFEMGVPGLPPSAVGVQAECEALQRGVASVYPIIDGIEDVKQQASRFVKAFLCSTCTLRGKRRICKKYVLQALRSKNS